MRHPPIPIFDPTRKFAAVHCRVRFRLSKRTSLTEAQNQVMTYPARREAAADLHRRSVRYRAVKPGACPEAASRRSILTYTLGQSNRVKRPSGAVITDKVTPPAASKRTKWWRSPGANCLKA